MSIIQLDSTQLDRLQSLCDQLGITPEFQPEFRFGEGLHNMSYTIEDLSEKIEQLDTLTFDVETDGRSKKHEAVINGLEQLIHTVSEITDAMNVLQHELKNTVCAYDRLTQHGDWQLLCTTEELKAIIDEHSDNNEDEEWDMSLGYNDGRYALLFSKIVDGVLQPPYHVEVFAQGSEEASDFINDYLISIVQPDEILDWDDMDWENVE